MRKAMLFVICAVFILTASAAQAETAKGLWAKVNDKISRIKDYQCVLNTFNVDTPTAIKYRPKASDGRVFPENWSTIRIEMTWKEPGYSYVKVLSADNSGQDLAARQVKKKPGTQIVFGYKDKKDIYGKFPKSGDPAIDKQLDKRIFHMPIAAFEIPRSIIGYHQNVKTVMAFLDSYFKSGKVTLDEAPMPMKKNLSYNPDNKSLKFDIEKTSRPFYRLTMIPGSVADNIGVTKDIVYINPTSLLPAQIESYEGDRLVMVLSIEDLQVNTGIDDSLWVSYFKGAQIFSPGNSK